jgi:CheY-like chemotaxis protein
MQMLTRAGYGVHVVSTGNQALACCAERPFDAITLDLLLPDMTGLDVLHGVRLTDKNHDTPVVVLSVVAERSIVAGFSVQDYLNKPVEERALLDSLQRAGVPPDKGGSILVVDDDPAAQRLMQTALERLGHEIYCSPSGEGALEWTARRRPLAVILDLLMPGVDGFEFLRRFRADSVNQSVPVIVWTMKELDHGEQRKLRGLAQRVIAKDDWTPAGFVAEVQRLVASRSSAERLGGS